MAGINLLRRMIETMGPMRNPLRKVSCGGEQQKRQAGQESIGEKFPAAVHSSGARPDRNPLVKSFLLWCIAAVPGRTGNYLGTVSCRDELQKRHGGQETIFLDINRYPSYNFNTV